MAELTLELRHLLNSDFELFDFTYKFDDPIFKEEIEQALIDRFYFNEIGQETPDRFKHRFMTRFKRIIPYYNNLHNTTLLSYNPLVNYTINEGLNQLAEATNNQENTGTSTSTQDNDGSSTSTQTGSTISANTGSTISDTDSTNTTDTTGNTLTTNNTQTDTDGTTTSTTNEKGSDYPDTPIAGATFLAEEKQSTGDSTNSSLSKNTGTVNSDNTSHSEGINSNSGTTSSKDDGTTETTSTLTGSNTSLSTLTGSTENNIVTRGTNKSNYEKTIEGLTGTSYQTLVRQERENLTRIIDSIIEEMKPSFYLVY